ncbi:MAG: hypothetical protein E6J41_25320 [Chloroflexi bacterium]|nr:MAG: hypothetical protein E6J41_25320 [Chloroflexota bacterium]
MKLLRDVFWTLVFFMDHEADKAGPPILPLLVALVLVVVVVVAWTPLSQTIPWGWLYLHWWCIPVLLVVGLALGQAGRR